MDRLNLPQAESASANLGGLAWYWWLIIALFAIIILSMLYYWWMTPEGSQEAPIEPPSTAVSENQSSGNPPPETYTEDFTTSGYKKTTGRVSGMSGNTLPPASSVAEAQQRAADDILYRMAYGQFGMYGTYGNW